MAETALDFERLLKEKYTCLTASQKKAADYIFQDLQKAALSTVVQLGQEAGISDTSVIRLAYSLGFASFSEMQKAIRRHVLENMGTPAGSGEEMQLHVKSEDPLIRIIGREIQAMDKLAHNLRPGDLERAAEALLQADQVLVMGYFNAYSVADELFCRLSMLRPNVHFYRTTQSESQRLYHLTGKSVVVAVSLPQHIRDTLSFIRQAKKQGAMVITITENELNPYSHEADFSFMVDINVDKETGFALLSPAMVLVFLLMQSVYRKGGDEIRRNLASITGHLSEQGIYL